MGLEGCGCVEVKKSCWSGFEIAGWLDDVNVFLFCLLSSSFSSSFCLVYMFFSPSLYSLTLFSKYGFLLYPCFSSYFSSSFSLSPSSFSPFSLSSSSPLLLFPLLLITMQYKRTCFTKQYQFQVIRRCISPRSSEASFSLLMAKVCIYITLLLCPVGV